MATVTIPMDEYDRLKSRDAELTLLENYGVDNWDGYGEALRGDEEDFE